MAKCVSNPSTVRPNGWFITPALAMTTSNGSPRFDSLARSHLGERREVAGHDLDPEVGMGGEALAPWRGACGPDHVGAVGSRRPGRLQPQARRDARHEHPSPREVDAAEDVVGRGVNPQLLHRSDGTLR